jgi:hypothetical protein
LIVLSQFLAESDKIIQGVVNYVVYGDLWVFLTSSHMTSEWTELSFPFLLG